MRQCFFAKRLLHQELRNRGVESSLITTADGLTGFIEALHSALMLNSTPKLVQRIPLKHLATFLGIAPQSLSRIKKKIRVNVRVADEGQSQKKSWET